MLIYGPGIHRQACDPNGPCNGWEKFDNNEITASITASNGNLYPLHKNGKTWKSTETRCSDDITCLGWHLLDNSPGARSILADGSEIYQIHGDGSIWHSITPGAPPAILAPPSVPGGRCSTRTPAPSRSRRAAGSFTSCMARVFLAPLAKVLTQAIRETR